MLGCILCIIEFIIIFRLNLENKKAVHHCVTVFAHSEQREMFFFSLSYSFEYMLMLLLALPDNMSLMIVVVAVIFLDGPSSYSSCVHMYNAERYGFGFFYS